MKTSCPNPFKPLKILGLMFPIILMTHNTMMNALAKDKKNRKDNVRFILLADIAKPVTKVIPTDRIESMIKSLRHERISS